MEPISAFSSARTHEHTAEGLGHGIMLALRRTQAQEWGVGKVWGKVHMLRRAGKVGWPQLSPASVQPSFIYR